MTLVTGTPDAPELPTAGSLWPQYGLERHDFRPWGVFAGSALDGNCLKVLA